MHASRQLPSLTVIAASAGSGKTHRLTNEFLSLLLSDNTPNSGLRNILAITFTHNAANEMKRRVLETLKHIILNDEQAPALIQQLSVSTGFSVDELSNAARLKIEELFDSYGDLQVQTIDSFIVEVFKTTAMDLGFAPGVDIAIQDATLIDRAFEELLREEGSNPELVAAVEKLIAEQQQRLNRYLWDPYRHILRETAELRKRVQHSAKPIDADGSGPTVAALVEHLCEAASSLLEQVDRSGLSVDKKFEKDLRSLAGGDIETVIGHSVKEKFFNAPKNVPDRATLDRIQPQVAQAVQQLYALLSAYAFAAAGSAYAPFIRTLESLKERMSSIARREGTIALGEIGRLLNASIQRSQVPEIYYKLGERLHHFLIDEFQDTSPLQWSIVKPLLEETLSGPGSLLVVGDTKQSIYSFRGADWRVMHRVAEGLEFSSVQPIIETLATNFRSDSVLVNYVRDLFTTRLQAVAPPEIVEAASFSGLTGNAQTSLPERLNAGVVRVEHITGAAEGQSERERLLAILADCRARNIRLSDIAVLAPRNTDVLEISSWLNEFNARQQNAKDQIPFLAQSGLDIRRRSVVRELIALLSFLDVPIDDLAFATVLSSELFRRRIHLDGRTFTETDLQRLLLGSRNAKQGRGVLYRAFERQFSDLWTTYFDPLFTRVGYLPLYDLAVEAIKAFGLFETFPLEEAALVRFLESVAAAESSGVSVLKEFLDEADEETSGDAWKLSAPETADAVNVMTIHKSKGLGFDVVVLMMHDGDPKPDSTIVDDEGDSVRLYATTTDVRKKNPELIRLYEHQLRLRQTDWLNTLYVALTRARHELHVQIVCEPGAQRLRSRILEPTALGTLTVHGARLARPVVRVRTHISDVPRKVEFVTTALPGIAETRRGDAVHAALARIEFIGGSVETTIKAAAASLNEQERGSLSESELVGLLTKFFEVDGVSGLFQKKSGRRVLNEREFVNAQGQLFRCDRVVVDDDRVAVVDYKTGSDENEEEYQGQVRNYVRLLKEIFQSKPVSGYLAYVDLKSVREVAS